MSGCRWFLVDLCEVLVSGRLEVLMIFVWIMVGEWSRLRISFWVSFVSML